MARCGSARRRTSTPMGVDSDASTQSPPAGIRQQNPKPGALRFPGEFCGKRPYLAAIEAEIAQCMVIEVAEGVVHGRCSTPLPIACIGPARGCDGCFDNRAHDRAHDRAKRERPVLASVELELIARRSPSQGRSGRAARDAFGGRPNRVLCARANRRRASQNVAHPNGRGRKIEGRLHHRASDRSGIRRASVPATGIVAGTNDCKSR